MSDLSPSNFATVGRWIGAVIGRILLVVGATVIIIWTARLMGVHV